MHTMTKETLAATLNGRQMGDEITPEECAQAKAASLVVIYGASDDLVEFRGAIRDEAYPGENGIVIIHRGGILDTHEDCDCPHCNFAEKAAKCATIKALWCEEPDWPWTYQTNLPHASFEVLEEGDKYCRGIVIDIRDLPVL